MVPPLTSVGTSFAHARASVCHGTTTLARIVRSRASTVEEYLAELPPERAAVVTAVRDLILANLPDGYVETMNWGMISYEVPLERCPDTYNGKPLMYAGLAAQKHHYAVYLQGVYASDEIEARLRAAYDRAGKRLDLGKSCLRFRRLDDVVLDAVGDVIAATDVDTYVAHALAARER